MKLNPMVVQLILLLFCICVMGIVFADKARAETGTASITFDDINIPDLGLSPNKTNPYMHTSGNGWDAIQIIYGQMGSDDYIKMNLLSCRTDKDLAANMGGYNNVMGNYQGLNAPDIKNMYKWIDYSDGTGPDHKIYYLIRPVSAVNKDYVSGNMAFYYGASMAVINFNLKGYSDEAAIATVKEVEAKARELLNRSITTPSPTPTPPPSPTPTPRPTPRFSYEYDPNSTTTVADSAGQVEWHPPGYDEWAPVQVGTYIPPGSSIRTLEDGKAEVRLDNGHVIKLESDSLLTVPDTSGKFREGPTTVLGVLYGKLKAEFWFFLDPAWKRLKGEKVVFYVRTQNALAGGKGTRFEVIIDNNSTTVNVLEGVVEVSDLNYTKNVTLGANQTTTVPPDGVPSSPKAFDWSTVDHWWTKFPAETANLSSAGASPTVSPQTSPLIFGFGAVLALVAVGYLKRR